MKPLPLGLRILVFMLMATGAAAAQAQMPSGEQLVVDDLAFSPTTDPNQVST